MMMFGAIYSLGMLFTVLVVLVEDYNNSLIRKMLTKAKISTTISDMDVLSLVTSVFLGIIWPASLTVLAVRLLLRNTRRVKQAKR